MTVPWRTTDLSVDPPIVETDELARETWTFAAGQTVSSASFEVLKLPCGPLLDGPVGVGGPAGPIIKAVSLASNVASVTIAGVPRGTTAELKVTFTTPAGRKWSRTLVVDSVA